MKEYSNFVVNRPWMTMLLLLMILLVSGYGAQYVGFKSDYTVFFEEGSETLTAYQTVQSDFSKSDNIAFYLSPENGDVFTPEILAAIQEITKEAWSIPHSSRVDSLTNYQHSWSIDDDMTVENLFPEYLPIDQVLIDRGKEVALNEPSLLHKIISPEAHVSLINVTVQLNTEGLEPVVVAKAREIQEKYMALYPDLDIKLTGMVMLNNTFSEAAMYDNGVLVPLMLLLVLLLMMFLLRSMSASFATLAVVVVSIFSAVGISGWLGINFSGPSASAPMMILTLAVADCIHVMSTVRYGLKQGLDKHTAIQDSLRINTKPVVLTSVTTAVGFFSMNFSDSPPFRDLGNIVAFGVMMACLFSLTLFPALLSQLPVSAKVGSSNNNVMKALSRFVIHRRKPVFMMMICLMVGLMSLAPKNKLNDNFVDYFDTSTEIRQTTDIMQKELAGIILMEVAIDSGQKNGISNPEFLNVLEAFTQWYRTQPEVDHVSSITDTFNRLNMNLHGDSAEFYKLPEDKELAAQYLLLYEMSLPYGLDLNNQINIDKSSTRIMGTLKNVTSVELLGLEKKVNTWFREKAPNYQVIVTGPDLMIANIAQDNVESMFSGTVTALVIISILIGLSLKSVKFAFISLIPNMAPAAMGFGAWYVLDGQVGLGLSVVAGMTLGIVVDYTVHFLSKYLHARRENGLSVHEAIQYSFENVGSALWVTTLVLVAGFSVLAQSSFKMSSEMGFLTAVTIVLAMIVDFFFLPPLLAIADRDKSDKLNSVSTERLEVSNAA